MSQFTQLKSLAHRWADASALAAAGHARGLGSRKIMARIYKRDAAKRNFLQSLKVALHASQEAGNE